MLPRSNRLNLKTDFKWTAAGKRIDTKFVKLFLKLGDNSSPRLGIAVSGKIFKKAVERNRAKRVVSAVFEALFQNLPEKINILALPKHNVLEVKSEKLLLDLKAVLKDEKIIT